MTFKATPEQEDCLEKFASGKNLRINAYAGCGKTSTLELIGAAMTKKGTYCAFNKSIADEAATKFPPHVKCKTLHSLAYAGLIRNTKRPNGYESSKLVSSINGGFLAHKLGLQGQQYDKVFIKPRSMGFLIRETLRRWQMSGRPELGLGDVPMDGKLAEIPPGLQSHLKAQVLAHAQKVWEMAIDPRSDMPLGFDGYLKLWALKAPQLPGSVVFLDEAQDTNGVVLGLMKKQQGQMVAVGDAYQQIYEWRGAINAMTELATEQEARLSQSWRFGTEIAGYASEILELLGETIPLRGNPARESAIGPVENPRTILFRTNGKLIGELLSRVEKGERPYVCGGTSEIMSFVEAAEKLMSGQSVERPFEFFGFGNWNEVQGAAQIDQDAELSKWVNLIDKHGTAKLRSAMERLPKDEKDGTVVLATGHKAKGREWNSVRLAGDFLRGIKLGKDDKTDDADADPIAKAEAHAAELRLFYVAATRGQTKLEVDPELDEKLDVLRSERAPAKPAEAA